MRWKNQHPPLPAGVAPDCFPRESFVWLPPVLSLCTSLLSSSTLFYSLFQCDVKTRDHPLDQPYPFSSARSRKPSFTWLNSVGLQVWSCGVLCEPIRDAYSLPHLQTYHIRYSRSRTSSPHFKETSQVPQTPIEVNKMHCLPSLKVQR